jgi:thioredoxin reductase
MINKCDVVIIGAGAAGMMCAIEAGKRGRKVVLLDHAKNQFQLKNYIMLRNYLRHRRQGELCQLLKYMVKKLAKGA